eukprot:8761388-Karenia_brevis.AAC.1
MEVEGEPQPQLSRLDQDKQLFQAAQESLKWHNETFGSEHQLTANAQKYLESLGARTSPVAEAKVSMQQCGLRYKIMAEQEKRREAFKKSSEE